MGYSLASVWGGHPSWVDAAMTVLELPARKRNFEHVNLFAPDESKLSEISKIALHVLRPPIKSAIPHWGNTPWRFVSKGAMII
jgi:hypothetical protein